MEATQTEKQRNTHVGKRRSPSEKKEKAANISLSIIPYRSADLCSLRNGDNTVWRKKVGNRVYKVRMSSKGKLIEPSCWSFVHVRVSSKSSGWLDEGPWEVAF